MGCTPAYQKILLGKPMDRSNFIVRKTRKNANTQVISETLSQHNMIEKYDSRCDTNFVMSLILIALIPTTVAAKATPLPSSSSAASPEKG